MSKPATKRAILQAASEIVHRKGFHHAGLNEILEAAHVPKGSFYYYFRSKEDFGLQLIDYFAGFMASRQGEILSDRTRPPLGRIRAFFDYFLSFFKEMNFELGCPIGNLAQEMGDLSETFRPRLAEAMSRMAEPVAACVAEAQQAGAIRADTPAAELADFIINSWEGALTRMKLTKNAEPLELFDRMLFERVLV